MTPPRTAPDLRRKRGQRLTLATTLVGLVMLALVAFWQTRPELVTSALGPTPLGFGRPASSLQIVAFLSPTCPQCAKFELTTGKDFYARAEAGEFYYAVYPLMLEDNHEIYTLALFCAYDSGGLPLFLTLHYKNYYLHENRGLSDLAKAARVDPKSFTQCLGAPRTVGRLKANLRWAKSLDVAGTPTFFIRTKDSKKFRRIEGNRGPKFWQRLLGATSADLQPGVR